MEKSFTSREENKQKLDKKIKYLKLAMEKGFANLSIKLKKPCFKPSSRGQNFPKQGQGGDANVSRLVLHTSLWVYERIVFCLSFVCDLGPWVVIMRVFVV
ncbi:hypothetical protein CsSME_00051303 [Camellia sinensis var. sinensis]